MIIIELHLFRLNWQMKMIRFFHAWLYLFYWSLNCWPNRLYVFLFPLPLSPFQFALSLVHLIEMSHGMSAWHYQFDLSNISLIINCNCLYWLIQVGWWRRRGQNINWLLKLYDNWQSLMESNGVFFVASIVRNFIYMFLKKNL